MAKRKTLTAQKRELLGKKVKRLRREGVLPANIYGGKVESLAVQVGLLEFERLSDQVGETEVLDLQVEGEGKARPTLIRNLQIDSVSGKPVHADFLQVDLTEKVTVAVPVKFMGEAPAVKEGKGVLLELKNEIEVEALPDDLPSEIEVDIASLKEINDAVLVKDIALSKGVEVQMEPEELICKIESQQVEEEEKKPMEEVAPEAPAQEQEEKKEQGKQ